MRTSSRLRSPTRRSATSTPPTRGWSSARSAPDFTAIATHDESLIEHAICFAQRDDIPRDRFQFQMLYGVRPRLQLELVARGYDVLVATPFGPEWYRYLMRRLAERPANLLFLLRNLVRG